MKTLPRTSKQVDTREPFRDAISFRLSVSDQVGVIKNVMLRFLDASQNILVADGQLVGAHKVCRVVVEDSTPTHGFRGLLQLCRHLQMLDYCNHLFAEFVRYSMPVVQTGSYCPPLLQHSRPCFESSYSGRVIGRREALHPDNADDSRVHAALYELDRAAAEFIKEPDRLLMLKPSELEKLVAEVYRVHGFDVRIQGGPRDHGIDVAARAYVPFTLPRPLAQHLKIGIQVKRYRRDRKVREAELRDLRGALEAEGYDKGVLVTTSSLTASAADYLSKRRAVRDKITIVAGDDVVELLVSYCRQQFLPFWR